MGLSSVKRREVKRGRPFPAGAEAVAVGGRAVARDDKEHSAVETHGARKGGRSVSGAAALGRIGTVAVTPMARWRSPPFIKASGLARIELEVLVADPDLEAPRQDMDRGALWPVEALRRVACGDGACVAAYGRPGRSGVAVAWRSLARTLGGPLCGRARHGFDAARAASRLASGGRPSDHRHARLRLSLIHISEPTRPY